MILSGNNSLMQFLECAKAEMISPHSDIDVERINGEKNNNELKLRNEIKLPLL